MNKTEYFSKAIPAALAAKHIWPWFIACAAAVESAWGESRLAREANNLLGEKSGFASAGAPLINLPTREFVPQGNEFPPLGTYKIESVVEGDKPGTWIDIDCWWPKFADWQQSFVASMRLLRNSHLYVDAMDAETGTDFIRAVSQKWATDPHRADVTLQIYRENLSLIESIVTTCTEAAPAQTIPIGSPTLHVDPNNADTLIEGKVPEVKADAAQQG